MNPVKRNLYRSYFEEKDDVQAAALLPSVLKKDFIWKLTKQFKALLDLTEELPKIESYLERFRIAFVTASGHTGSKLSTLLKGIYLAKRAFRKTIDRFANERLMRLSCYRGHGEMARILHDEHQVPLSGLDAGCKNYSLLHFTIEQGLTDLSLWLIKNNSPLDAKEAGLGRTPLHLACLFGNEKVAGALIRAGASISILDKEGNTPLNLSSSAHPQKMGIAERAALTLRIFALGEDSVVNQSQDKPTVYLTKKNLKQHLKTFQNPDSIPPFPHALWVHILGFLPKRDLLTKVMPVSRSFYNFATESLLTSYFKALPEN